jgi:uncharacterized protein YfkK (UPF0435 family)
MKVAIVGYSKITDVYKFIRKKNKRVVQPITPFYLTIKKRKYLKDPVC